MTKESDHLTFDPKSVCTVNSRTAHQTSQNISVDS